ncbi:CASP2 [Mytilus edulis]|uniref:CASP2 n=1 Tax=Mytilus edulis TaxID=6550 RepID=A0A8S3T9L2_MYTED|nr:CASP2 [Mytilus edulis]
MPIQSANVKFSHLAKRPRLAENGIIKILSNEDPKSKRIPPMTLVSAQSKEVLSSEVETETIDGPRSHGEEGYIFGTDGRKIFLDNIMSLFENGHCKDLRGKPKIFIIQACRGEALDSGVVFVDRHDESQRTTFQLRTKSDILISVPAHTGVQHSGKMYGEEHDGSPCKPYQLPTMSDMLICFPTQTGHYAWRNKDRGSWYIEALVQVFMKFARTEDVCTMLNRVNSVISRKLSNCQQIEMNQMSQMSEYKCTLRMPHFFFFPGIGNE